MSNPTLEDMSPSPMLPDVPQALPPLLVMGEPNEPVTLYQGMARFRGTGTVELETTVEFRWLPDPEVIVRAAGAGLLMSVHNPYLEMEVAGRTGSVLVVEYSPEDGMTRGKLDGQMLLVHGDPSIDAAHFALANFHEYHGQMVVDGRSYRSARLQFGSTEFLVTVDETAGAHRLKGAQRVQGGFVVTHTGKLVRRDGGRLSESEMDEVASALYFFFAFIRGAWCGPILVGSKPSTRTGTRIIQPWRVSRPKNVGSWFPVRPDASMDAAFERFLELWRTPEWQMPLRHYIWWYIEANEAASLESAIVHAQAALELMGWLWIVESSRVAAESHYNKAKAAEKLSLLLAHGGIPTEIPSHLAHLREFASVSGHADGPSALVEMRNAIVHPRLRRRERLAEAGTTAKFEAAELARQYVEFVLLALLGYEGVVTDRTARTHSQVVREQQVAWARRVGDDQLAKE